MQRFVLPLVLSVLGACASTASLPAGEPVGEPMLAQEIVQFATVHADPSAFYERTVLVEATATAVCKKAGCWMQIEDQGQKAMVRWESGCGGKYKFPEVVGQRVLIQGSFYPKTITQEDAEHIEEEAGGGVEIEREGYEFNASSVLVLDGKTS